MIVSVDLEIKALIEKFGDTSVVAEHLVQEAQSQIQELSKEQIEDICRFPFLAGRFAYLIPFVLSLLDDHEDKVPWKYFLGSLGKTMSPFSEEFSEFMLELIQSQNLSGAACLSESFQMIDPRLSDYSQEIQRQRQQNYLIEKNRLFEELEFLKTQQLEKDEQLLLERMMRLFPDDGNVAAAMIQFRNRTHVDFLNKNKSQKKLNFTPPPEDPQVAKWGIAFANALIENSNQKPDMAYDFAMAAFMIEEFDACSMILEQHLHLKDCAWLLIESKLRAQRFVELIPLLAQVELLFASSSDTFFATAYYRAQAYWGLGETHKGIEILQSLIDARPEYRSASALLAAWENP